MATRRRPDREEKAVMALSSGAGGPDARCGISGEDEAALAIAFALSI
jgi:hypothetical protein